MKKQFGTIEFEDRKAIAVLYAKGVRTADIADKIGVPRTTVYTELKRGQDSVTLDKNLRFNKPFCQQAPNGKKLHISVQQNQKIFRNYREKSKG